MKDFDTYAEEMKRQAQATLAASEPELARSVLEQVVSAAREEPEFAPLTALAVRICAGVIARFLEAKKLADAEAAWTLIERLAGDTRDIETRVHLGLCASNLLNGRLLHGKTKPAKDAFAVLARITELQPRVDELDRLLAEGALRLIAVWLQLHPAQEAYDFFILLRRAAERHPGEVAFARCRAKACLLLIAAFSHGGDPNFARSLRTETEAVLAAHPDDEQLSEVGERLKRLYS